MYVCMYVCIYIYVYIYIYIIYIYVCVCVYTLRVGSVRRPRLALTRPVENPCLAETWRTIKGALQLLILVQSPSGANGPGADHTMRILSPA